MDKNKICLHQWIKPSKETKIKLDGVGDCDICTPHEDNKYCKRYCEITKPDNFKIGKEKEMPYIKQELRPNLDEVVEAMENACVCANGDLNYILYAFCKRHVTPSYNAYKNFCGELRQCATEIERRILGPYEDKKIEENGDVN